MDGAAIRRRLALGLAVLAGSGALALALPGTAQAADSTCAGRQVKTLAFATGSVRVYRQDGYVCAVTVPKQAGRAQSMSVTVQARGLRPVTDKGRFTQRAGPVTVYAGHRCVRVSGSVAAGSATSGWFLC
ncbi:hypothetical protein ABZ858_18800 [Streptomyces sp. NPDC047017]|uniref:hypothetical protein n=1 Tax=Streptomyces sp. NPDC047017 TaxID=3155024 RepID=UPI0033D851E4